MKRKNADCKGSALVFLLFAISVIVIVGTVVLTLAVMNFKMKKLNSDVKKAFYLSESGIDEAYIISRQFIDESISYAIDKAEDFNKIEKKSKNESINTQEGLNDEIYTDEIANEVFQSAFRDYLKGTCRDAVSSKGLLNMLNDNTSYLIYEDGYPQIDASLIENSNDFLIEVKSIYVYQNIKEEIIFKFKVDIPIYDTDTINSNINADDLIHIIDWKIER